MTPSWWSRISTGISKRAWANVEAALLGAREVGFTVLSISMSLIAVFMPILFMGGMIGRFFREFAMTLSVAILVSLVISLTTTPMLCALVMRKQDPAEQDGARLSLFQKIFERPAYRLWRQPCAGRCAIRSSSCWCWQ